MSEHNDHPSYLGHHYDTPEQQFTSGKLGMWLFLATEILLFAGLFCAYAVYRSNHPDIFIYAHQFLDKKLGGINTIVLITSSFTMAMAVRSAQLGKRSMTSFLLVLTLLGAVGFLLIKKIEYEAKWKHGLLWGERYQPEEHGDEHQSAPGGLEDGHSGESPAGTAPTGEHDATGGATGSLAPVAVGAAHAADSPPAAATDTPGTPAEAGHPAPAADHSAAAAADAEPAATAAGVVIERSTLPLPATPPQGLATPAGELADQGHASEAPKNVHIFFGIYFLMTGLHGIHVVAGMIAIGWALLRNVRGDFSAEYSTPVDLVGLYWHLVDLIWIFLFPLLYLIH